MTLQADCTFQVPHVISYAVKTSNKIGAVLINTIGWIQAGLHLHSHHKQIMPISSR